MATKKAWYWLAAGVLALGINSEYHNGKLQWIHHYVDHSLAVADAYASCAGRYLAQAHLLLSLTQSNSAPAQTNVEDADVRDAETLRVNDEVQYALAQAKMAREEIEQHRPDIEQALTNLECQRVRLARAQQLADDAVHGLVICPRSQHIRVAMPQVRTPQVSVAVPPIHVAVPRMHVEGPAVTVAVPEVNVHVPQVNVPQVNVAPIDDDLDGTI